MVFAQLDYAQHYSDFHAGLLAVVERHFTHVQSGHQGDSWIWILDGGEKVAIDTFTSMKHQVKSPQPGAHVEQVLEVLARNFRLRVYDAPEHEAHEHA